MSILVNKNSSALVAIKCFVYNHEPYLRDCLDGFVMQQTNFPFVAIVHDDASTDGSAAIIREYEEKYPDIIKPIYETENQYSKHDGSLGRIMNAAIDATGAKYVAMCEGDDYWTDPLKLQKQVDFLENHPEYSMCFHGAEIKIQGVDRSKCGARCEYVQDKEYSATDLFAEWIVPTASIVYDRQRVNQYSIKHPEWVTRGDIILVLKCAHVGKVWGMSDKMSVYRVQPNGVTYDQIRRTAEIDKLPNHFKCIYINFPKINKQISRWHIAYHYFLRLNYSTKFTQKISNFILATIWGPQYTFDKIGRFLKRKLQKL